MTFGEILYIFVTLLAMVNPVEAAAAFATLTEGRSSEAQATIARRATVVSFGILVIFGFLGEELLQALGVSIPAFEIAGGLLLLRVGFNMVFAEKTDSETADTAKVTAAQAADPSVFPLAIPIITGPGALTASVTLVSQARDQWLAYGVLVVCAVVVFAITWGSMRGSEWLTKVLGRTGVDATGRIVGILVAAIAVQIIINGVTGLGLIHGR
ncbi:MAG TPA: MarC family protein [Candidatus Baltobacteraceae bacterium]|nr:MarC family protein [Candidatus Baltobacteraceae bacterium]